jgi:hypothetical protein
MNTQEVIQRIQEDPTLLQILGAALANHPLPADSRQQQDLVSQQQDFASQEQSDFVSQRQPQFTYAPGQQLDLLPGPRQQLYHGHSLDWANYLLLDREVSIICTIDWLYFIK